MECSKSCNQHTCVRSPTSSGARAMDGIWNVAAMVQWCPQSMDRSPLLGLWMGFKGPFVRLGEALRSLAEGPAELTLCLAANYEDGCQRFALFENPHSRLLWCFVRFSRSCHCYGPVRCLLRYLCRKSRRDAGVSSSAGREPRLGFQRQLQSNGVSALPIAAFALNIRGRDGSTRCSSTSAMEHPSILP